MLVAAVAAVRQRASSYAFPPLLRMATVAAASATAAGTRTFGLASTPAPRRAFGITTATSTTSAPGTGSTGGSSTTTTAKPKTAVLLMNMGGPRTLADVGDFLLRLFSDHDLIPLPFQPSLARFIARRRTSKIQDQYAKIGGGSPILMWTQRQAALLEAALDRAHPESGGSLMHVRFSFAPATSQRVHSLCQHIRATVSTTPAPHKSYIAFRYAAPLTETAVRQMREDGVTRAVALTLYPQYSCSTTGSSLNELHRQIRALDPAGTIKWSAVDRWPTNDLLVEAFTRHIRTALLDYPEAERDDVVLLFSAHSLPMSVVNRGDTYPQEVGSTVARVMERLGHSNPYRLVWQSQVGPSAWLGPKTELTVEGYAKKGKRNLLIVPIAFVSDHIETLFELDLEYGKLAKEHGATGYRRVESLNDDPLFIDALADVVTAHLDAGSRPSRQLALRCPSCSSKDCGPTRDFFCRPVESLAA
ncbi:ferrochelatase hem15 [Cladochytrium tenue]|nr:ferrochelatase hem15 [Cladochytrium tenue]